MYNDEILPLESTFEQMADEYAQMLKLHKAEKSKAEMSDKISLVLNEIYNMENCSKEKITFQIRFGRLKKTRRLTQIIALKTKSTELIKELLNEKIAPIKCDKCENSFSPPNSGGVRRDLMDCQLFILEKCDELILSGCNLPAVRQIAYIAIRCLTLY